MTPIVDAVAIPNDPNLEGVKVWFQYVADLGNGAVLLSEISAVPVLADATSLAAPAPDPSVRRTAAADWLRQHRDPEGQTVLRRIQSALRRGR